MAEYRTLRLSVTDRCNLRCRYCMPAEGVPHVPHDALPSLEELGAMAGFLVERLGIRKVRLTGGEPLVRRGLVSLVRSLAALPGLSDLALTTNGVLLPSLAAPLKEAGLRRINLSLDTLDAGRFFHLTRGGDLRRSLAGLEAALAAGLGPVKLNAVLRKSTYREDVPALLDFAGSRGLAIRFIELMRTGSGGSWAAAEFVSAEEVRREVGLGGWRPETRGASPARDGVIPWRGRPVRIGWITPVSDGFCASCDRLRMDARGRIFRCLMDKEGVDFRRLWREEGPQGAERALEPYLARKRPPAEMVRSEAMSAVGG